MCTLRRHGRRASDADTHDTHDSREQWKRIFDSLSRIYEGSTSRLEILSPDLGAQHEVEEMPFLGITYDANGLELQFETKDGRIHVHNEPRPKMIQIEENDEGLVDAVWSAAAMPPLWERRAAAWPPHSR